MAYPASSFEIKEIENENENRRSPATLDASPASFSTAADPINSSSSSVVYGHDVFINHRGPDTKKTFAGHLYYRLLSHGFRPFLDQPELEEGLPFPSQIEDTIRSASIHVAIFSPTYAESYWCLHELLLMQESKALIIPVFYGVKPGDMRWTDQNKGVYGGYLEQLQLKKIYDPETDQENPRYDPNIIEKWKKALSSAADISGFDLADTVNGDEALMLHRLVDRVVKIMAKNTLFQVDKYPTGLDEKVGLEEKVKEFKTTILTQQHGRKVQVAGIVGLGGAGKTTLAQYLFDRERSKYSYSYLLSDVRENAKKKSLHSLQREVLKGRTRSDLPINHIDDGIRKLRKHLEDLHVLLILDDIDHEDQLKAFLPIKDVLGSNSLILITSRDRNVLLRAEVEEPYIYNLTGLTLQHSRKIFCLHAFHQAYPLQDFEHLIDEFLKVCNGLPLSLKVMGAHLFGNNAKSDWEGVLQQVKVLPDIQKILRISYDALSEEEKNIFLDIACFFIGEDKDSAIEVWKGSDWLGSLGFKSLEGKCLVEVDRENVIHMHDHLRDMGREFAENELPRRLWSPTKNIYDLLHQTLFFSFFPPLFWE